MEQYTMALKQNDKIHQISSKYIPGIICIILYMFGGGLVLVDFTHILQGYPTGTGAITWLPQCSEKTLMDMGKWFIVIPYHFLKQIVTIMTYTGCTHHWNNHNYKTSWAKTM